MKVININQKLNLFSEYWNPKVIGELNGQLVKLAKFKGEFVWHKHDNEDELFYILEGKLKIEFRDKEVSLNQGEFIIVPKGVEHKPIAIEECSVMLFEPKDTVNTGNVKNKLTQQELDNI